MNRRRFLSVVALSGVAAAVAGTSFWTEERKHGSDRNHRKLLREFRKLEAPRLSQRDALGKSYLQKHPNEADADFLSKSIAKACLGREEEEECTATQLQYQIRSDFASGRTERVDGWILSRLEARLHALSYVS